MKFLLDVNVLLALAVAEHQFHAPVVRWMKPRDGVKADVATCAITELGLVRILSQPIYGYSIADAQRLLRHVKSIPELNFTFLPDDQSALDLPAWVNKQSQVTDGHLSGLAKKHGAELATLDRAIPGAFLIPT